MRTSTLAASRRSLSLQALLGHTTVSRCARAASLALLLGATSGCKKEPAAPAAAPAAAAVEWDPKSSPNDAPDWPMSPETLSAASQASFAKVPGLSAGAKAHLALWVRLKPFDRNYLKAWKAQLAAEPASPVEAVDAFLELATQVTGPTGFWRKTVPGQWLGCAADPESEPCQKMGAMNAELSQWDGLVDRLQKLEPGEAQKFVQKNLPKMLAYLDTYVPETNDPEGMKKTPFFAKHLAAALEGQM